MLKISVADVKNIIEFLNVKLEIVLSDVNARITFVSSTISTK